MLSICMEKPVRVFFQMDQCNFSTNKIEWEECFPFVGKTSENFPPNGTVHFFTDKPHISSSVKTQMVSEGIPFCFWKNFH